MMRIAIALLFGFGFASPAAAQWMLDGGAAIVAPVAGNSNVELLVLSCGDPYRLEVLARGGAVAPGDVTGDAPVDYFYQPGRIVARIDTDTFPLVAAGSDAAVVLYSEGTAAQDYMAAIDPAFVAALRSGSSLTLAFDITPEAAADGTPHETVAEFPLGGSSAILDSALGGCG